MLFLIANAVKQPGSALVRYTKPGCFAMTRNDEIEPKL